MELPDEVVDLTQTAWVDESTVATEVATATVHETTVVVTGISVTGVATGGRKISGGGRVERDMGGFVVCVLVFCFSVGGAF